MSFPSWADMCDGPNLSKNKRHKVCLIRSEHFCLISNRGQLFMGSAQSQSKTSAQRQKQQAEIHEVSVANAFCSVSGFSLALATPSAARCRVLFCEMLRIILPPMRHCAVLGVNRAWQSQDIWQFWHQTQLITRTRWLGLSTPKYWYIQGQCKHYRVASSPKKYCDTSEVSNSIHHSSIATWAVWSWPIGADILKVCQILQVWLAVHICVTLRWMSDAWCQFIQ